jgi:hypothetical protein
MTMELSSSTHSEEDHPDPERARMRAAVAAVELALGEVSSNPPEPVREAWNRLVRLLALGPAPALRACPSCGRMGMREATRCGSCWVSLTPPATP